MSAIDTGVGLLRRRRCAPTEPPIGDVPTVTVVIPCYNYARYLEASVMSALTQEGVRPDVVIVDDASTDESLMVARGLAAKNPQVTVVAQAQNLGAVSTFNRGLEHVQGEFLVRLDADDLLTPGSLKRATAVARAFPSVGLVYGHPVHFTSDNQLTARTNPSSWTVWPGTEWLRDRCRSGTSVITAPEVLMRSSVVDSVGGQQPLAHAHDTEMWMRIAAFSDVAHIEGADQAWHRDHEGSLSSSVDIVTDLEERRAAFRTLLSGPAGRLPEADELLRAAMRALAGEALTVACRDHERGRADHPRVRQLIEYAMETIEGVEGLPQWRALQRRLKVRESVLQGWPVFIAPMVVRKAAALVKQRRWARDGV